MSNNYYIEHRISTPIRLAIFKDSQMEPKLIIDKIKFAHEDFNIHDGWVGNSWIASGSINAENFGDAINIFRRKLRNVVAKISLISQCYIDYNIEAFLIHKEDENIAFFHFVKDRNPTGLVFNKKQKEGVESLMNNQNIPASFYYYWNDAVNTTGYSAKLLLMFSAIESLVKIKKGKKDWTLVETVLGEELKKELFGEKGDSNNGLRHRLIHGEYFVETDHSKNYVDEIHNKVVSYFNNEIFKEELIQAEVVNPHRSIWGNKIYWDQFIKRNNNSIPFNLKPMINSIDEELLSFSQKSGYLEVDPPEHNRLLKDY